MIHKADCEDFGVCTKEEFFQDNKSLVLHLRIHSKTDTISEAPEHTDISLTQLPQNETYHEIMKYKPSLHNVPVAYEKDNTDSMPFFLCIKNSEDTTKSPEIVLTSSVVEPVTQLSNVSECNEDCSVLQQDAENKWCCWWCTYSFNQEPFSLPIRIMIIRMKQLENFAHRSVVPHIFLIQKINTATRGNNMNCCIGCY